MKKLLIGLTILSSFTAIANNEIVGTFKIGLQAYAERDYLELRAVSDEMLELRNNCYKSLEIDRAKVECKDIHFKWTKLNELSDELWLQEMIENSPISFEATKEEMKDVHNQFKAATSKKEMYDAINVASDLMLKVKNEEQLITLRSHIRDMFKVIDSK